MPTKQHDFTVIGEVVNVPVERIVRNPDQPRRKFYKAKLQELGRSMKEAGQEEPVKVFLADDGLYMLKDGERRWKAAQLVGLPTLQAIIVPRPDECSLLESALIMGIQREPLTPMEEAAAYQRLHLGFEISIWQVSQRVGKSDAHVRGRLVWMHEGIPSEIRDMIDNNQFPRNPDVAQALLKLPNNEARLKLAQRLAGKSPAAIIAACEKYVEMATATATHKAVLSNGNGNGHGKPAPNGNGYAGIPASLRLGVNGTPPPTSIPLTTMRVTAQAMCRNCEIKAEQLEKLAEPAWYLVTQAAEATCNKCGLSEHDLSLCKRCPAVDLLKRLTKGAH